MKDSINQTIRISLLGDTTVGKTSIKNVYLGEKFSEDMLLTAAIHKEEKIVELNNGDKIIAKIWDTAGQERFRPVVLQTLKNGQGIVLVFDVTKRETFNGLKSWLDDINKITTKVKIILFGNKCDADDDVRAVTEEEAKQFANENNILYIETSAKENVNIEKGFSQIINDTYAKYGATSGFVLKKKEYERTKCC